MVEEDGRVRAVLVGHSMGCLVVSAFLQWAAAQPGGESWVAENIESLVAIAGPFLGAPVAERAVVSGVRTGLGPLLPSADALRLCRSFGSLSWLLPHPKLLPLLGVASTGYARSECALAALAR